MQDELITMLNDQIIEKIKQYERVFIKVEGHTDSRGNKSRNMLLSETRAKAVISMLILKSELDADRFTLIAHGNTKPIADNSTKEGRSKNRRVELTIFQK